jgi:hypothetical protein
LGVFTLAQIVGPARLGVDGLPGGNGLENDADSVPGGLGEVFECTCGGFGAPALAPGNYGLFRVHALGEFLLRQARARAGVNHGRSEPKLFFQIVVGAAVLGSLSPMAWSSSAQFGKSSEANDPAGRRHRGQFPNMQRILGGCGDGGGRLLGA